MASRSTQGMTAADMWPAINPSRLRHQVQIQAKSTTTTGTGSPQSSWMTVRSPWASIDTVHSREGFQSGEFSSEVTHIITLRWSPTLIAPGMQVLFTEQAGTVHTYTVQAVDNVKMRNVQLNLMCIEINGGQ